MADDRTIRVRFLAEVNSYLDGVRKAGTATADFGKQISGHGTAVKADMEKVGRSALVMAGGLGLALGASAKAAMDWESAFAGVEKTLDTTGLSSQEAADALGEMEDGLRSLARELPATHQEIAAVAEAAGQLGIQRESILEFTEVMIALGETTNLSADEAATSIAQFMNIMKTAPQDVDNLSSALVDLGNNGASTERDIVEMAQRLAGAGRMIGASEQEILALSSAMADLGIQAQLGGGAMSRQLRNINSAVLENGDRLQSWAEIANVSAAEFGRVWRDSPAKAMDLVAKGLGRVRDAGGDVAATLKEVGVKGTQDLDVMGRLAGAGDRISHSLGISNKAWKENLALQEEAAKRYGTTESKMQVTKNKVNDLAIDLGNQLLPAISMALDAVGGLADAFGSLPAGAQTGIVALGGVAFAASAFVGIAGTLIPKVRDLDKALQGMGLGSNFASRNLGRLATAGVKAGLIVGTLYAVGEGLDALFDEDNGGNATKIERDLRALAAGAELAGDAELDLDRIREAIERIGAPSVATQIEHIGEEITSLGGLLGESTDDLDAAKEAVDGLDKTLAALAQTDPEAAAAALEAIKEALGPEDFNRLLPLLDDYEVSLVALENAGGSAAAGIEEVTNAAGVSEKALEDLADAVDAIFNSLYGVEAAADQFQQGLNDLDDVMKQAVEGGLNLNNVLNDQSDGALTLRGHMRDLASDASAVIQEWVEQGVTGQELTDKIDGLSRSFEDQARAAGVPQPVIDHYLELLKAIPAEVDTTVVAKDEATFVILGIQAGLDKLVSKTITITTVESAVRQGYTSPVNQNMPKVKKPHLGGLVRYLADGGHPGWPSGTDTVPAWLTPGEFVVREPAVRKLGLGTMQAINSGRYPSAPAPRSASGGSQVVEATLVVPVSIDGQQIMQPIRKQIRIQGGDVQQVLGR